MANLSWTKFFWYRPLLLLSSTYWPFSLCTILKKSYSGSWVMRMCHFQAQNGQFVMNKIFLVQTITITFIYLLALFIVHNFKKILLWILSYEDVPFLGPKQIFFWKIINSIFIYLLAPFIVENFRNFFPVYPELWGCTIFGPKMAHFPK